MEGGSGGMVDEEERQLQEGTKKGKTGELKNKSRERSGSMGVLDLWKRKREVAEGLEKVGNRVEGEREQTFKRSKKTPRSPTAQEEVGGEREGFTIMEEMKEWMESCSRNWERMEESLREIARELEGMRKREEKWREDRDKMEKRIEELEKKWERGLKMEDGGEGLKDIEERVNKLEGRGRGDEGGGEKDLEERVKKVERMWDRRERQERRRNVVVKGYKVDGRGMNIQIKEIFEKIRAEVEIDDIRVVKTGREEWGGMAVVSLRSEEDKKEVMRKKKELRGDKIWIEEDLTWKERQSRWKLKEVARSEERKGARVIIGNNRVMIEGEWWFWDEEKETLRDKLGKKRESREEKNSGEGVRRGRTEED